MSVLVLGASGMLGNAMFRVLAETEGVEVHGSVRSADAVKLFPDTLAKKLLGGVDVSNEDALHHAFTESQPDIVINCVGLIHQREESRDALRSININAALPHRLARLCEATGARLIHISTDYFLPGAPGSSSETAPLEITDLYGASKFLGEVDYAHAVTLRTSPIGHALSDSNGLIDWFLSQEGQCSGYTGAIFSGLPSMVLAEVVRDRVIPNPELQGVYHVAAEPIAKYDLLKLVADIYGKAIEILPDNSVQIDRSLDAARFAAATGYTAPPWRELIEVMHSYHKRWGL